MRELPLASLVMANDTDDQFLPATIDRALNQTDPGNKARVVGHRSTANARSIRGVNVLRGELAAKSRYIGIFQTTTL